MGIIFDIKRYAIHDGPGIRTTVFLKGCPLDCSWCHNPEGKAMESEFMWRENRCLGCRACQKSCPKSAISFDSAAPIIDYSKCIMCLNCVDACYSEALELVGRDLTVPEVMEEINKDRVFFDESGGGVTFSGGEPTTQPEFLVSLLVECKKMGIHTAVDTSGYTTSETLLEISELVDLFLYDLKLMDDEKHKKYCGVSNGSILNNLRKLSERGNQIIIRFPLIPDVNDDEENVEELEAFVSSLRNVKDLSILPYHKTGVFKNKRLKGRAAFTGQIPTEKKIFNIQQILEKFGLSVKIGG
jgi:pyruvate formate lyase activating enzyme